MTFRRFMGFTAMAFLWTGSQIPVYLFGTILLRSTHSRQWLTISNRWYTSLYLWIHWRSRPLDLVCKYIIQANYHITH